MFKYKKLFGHYREDEKYFSALENAPGPSPWYFDNKIIFNHYQWKKWAEKNILSNQKGEILMFADFYCCFKELSDGFLIGWIEKELNIHFFLFDIKKLHPIKELDNKISSKNFIGFYFEEGLVSKFIFNMENIKLSEKFAVPEEFKKIGELLILGSPIISDDLKKYSNKAQRSILFFNFQNQIVTIFPQDWFNNGDYDFGYQWITKIAFISSTKEIVGGGIRLGTFVLDKSYRHVSRWLNDSVK